MKSSKSVLLINPRQSVSKGSIRRLPTHLGLMYMAAVLEEGGHKVSIMDSPCEGYDHVVEDQGLDTYGLSDDDLASRFRQHEPDFIGISCLFSKQEAEVIKTCRIAKQTCPKAKIVVGGMYPTLFAREFMTSTPEIDFIIQREGETRLLDLVNGNKSYGQQDGVVFRKNGEIISNSAHSIEDINKLPFPARHLVDLEKYIKIGLFSNPFPKKERIEQVLTSRGCSYGCDFCTTPRVWGTYRRRDASNILEEIIQLKEEYGIEEIQFRDDNLTIDRKNALALFKTMKPLGLVWCSGAMIRTLDEEMVIAMAESGCYKLTLSPESGSERVLKELMRKPLRLELVKPAIDICHKHGISVHSDFIVGYPGETREEVAKTFEFAKTIGTDSASFFIASPNPGSSLYDRAVKKGWLQGGWKGDYKSSGIHIRPSDKEYLMSEEELEALVESKTYEHNQWVKERNPMGWEDKYRVFLMKHPELSDNIMGRVVCWLLLFSMSLFP